MILEENLHQTITLWKMFFDINLSMFDMYEILRTGYLPKDLKTHLMFNKRQKTFISNWR